MVVLLLSVWNCGICFWSLSCVCGKKKVCLHSSRFLVFLLEQMYLVLLKQLVLPFVFCHYTGCQPPGHWLASLIIHKKIYLPLSAASSYVLDLSVIKGKPWMCFQATTLASQFLGKQNICLPYKLSHPSWGQSVATSVTIGIQINSQIPGLLHHCSTFVADITQLQWGFSGAVLHHGWEPTVDSVTVSLTSGLPADVAVVADIRFSIESQKSGLCWFKFKKGILKLRIYSVWGTHADLWWQKADFYQ